MFVKEITPRRFEGRFRMPGSKSYTNRALICAALADGKSVLENAAYCDDTTAMRDSLRHLGAGIEYIGGMLVVEGHEPEALHPAANDIYVGAAGTAMRFLTGLCSLIDGHHRIVGTERMHQRPLDYLADALNQTIDGEVLLESINSEGRLCPPVRIDAGGLIGNIIEIRADSDSQFLSSLLMASPYSRNDVQINAIGDIAERPYIDMTMETMKKFGADVTVDGKKYFVSSGRRYRPTRYAVESDASSAIYFMAAAAITGGKVAVGEFGEDSKQGDLEFSQILDMMGCSIGRNGRYVEVQGPEKLRGIDVDLGNMPDVVQTLAVLAAISDGETTIRNVKGVEGKRNGQSKRHQAGARQNRHRY